MNTTNYQINKNKLIWGGSKKLLSTLLLSLCLTNGSVALAQDSTTDGQQIATTSSRMGVSDLKGSDIEDLTADSWNSTTNDVNGDEARDIFLFYNPATKMFINIGGYWGSHAVLSNSPLGFFKVKRQKGGDLGKGEYVFGSLTNNVSGTDRGCLMSYVSTSLTDDEEKPDMGLYLDRNNTSSTSLYDNEVWILEQVTDGDFAESDYVYTIKCKRKLTDGSDMYVTAYPSDELRSCETMQKSNVTDDKYRYWKLIKLSEYQELYNQEIGSLDAYVDITPRIGDPNFSCNNADLDKWKIVGNFKDGQVSFGIKNYYRGYKTASQSIDKKYNAIGEKTEEVSGNNNDYLRNYCMYMAGEIYGSSNGSISQDIEISHPGWYILQCKGVTSTNYACLFIQSGSTDSPTYHYTALKQVDRSVMTGWDEGWSERDLPLKNGGLTNISYLLDTRAEDYTSELLIFFPEASFEKDTESNLKPQTIKIGISTRGNNGTVDGSGDDWTVFKNFRLYYAGKNDLPDLVLSEENLFTDNDYLSDLGYLKNTTITFNNKPLHLKRIFTLNKWNSIILPVSFNKDNFERAFGEDAKLAELGELTNTQVHFYSVTSDDENGYFFKANTPYIIYPTKEPTEQSDYSTNYEIESQGSSSTSTEEDEATETGASATQNQAISLTGKHYLLLKATLDQDTETGIGKYSAPWKVTGEKKTAPNGMTMTAYGLLAQNYDVDSDGKKTQRKGYDEVFMTDSYLMSGGVLTYKKNGAVSKAFRCFFKLTEPSSTENPAKQASLSWALDGVTIDGGTTAIEQVDFDEDNEWNPSAKYEHNIYNMSGQLVSSGSTSTAGLPKGIYIVNGRKTVVK